MATIDLKLKSYDELQFEIMRLITDNHLKQQQITQLTNNWNELENYVGGYIYLLKTNPDIIEEGQIDTLYEVLNKMKEIKEGKK